MTIPGQQFVRRWLPRVAWGVTGVVVTALYLYYLQSQALPDLQFWHQKDVAASTVPEADNLEQLTLDDYLAHETRIFSRLGAAIAERDARVPGWHRYGAVAFSVYQQGWPDGNRTQLQTPAQSRGAALLVHGLSDSTHSMRPLAGALYGHGFRTLNLRMPGHGTLPAALLNVGWQQFRDAFRLGARALAADLPAGQPLIVAGYSNGAALALDYTVDALASDGELRVPDLLILLSPAVQVSPMAAYASIQRWIAELPGMAKLGWTDVVAEFDPFKYNSFPVKAGEEIYRLTARLQKRLSRMPAQQLQRFPRVLSFQSVLDSTIPADAVVSGLLDRLQGTPAEAVYFDINRNSSLLPLLVDSGRPLLQALTERERLDFDLTVVGNSDDTSERVSIRTRRSGQSQWQESATDMRWPRGVYSLSHVALPFDASDPVYGVAGEGDPLRIGDLWFRGERGGLAIPLGLLTRQRYNPFFSYLEQRVLEAADRVSTEVAARE